MLASRVVMAGSILGLAAPLLAQTGPVSQVQGWGSNSWGQLNLPAGLYRKVACGSDHSVAIRHDGTLVAVGHNLWGCLSVPSGTFIDVAAGENFAVAIRTDGTLAGWGNNDAGQATPPAGVYTQVVAGRKHALALRPDGTAVGWGDLPFGIVPPPDAFVQIDTNIFVSIGRRADGTLATWGPSAPAPPTGQFIDIAAGYSLWFAAIRASDGAIVAWGSNSVGQLGVPPGRFVDLDVGANVGVGVREDGQAVVWGDLFPEIANVPINRAARVSMGILSAFAMRCPANCDESTMSPVLTVNDFVCFLNRFAAGDAITNCDGSTVPPLLNVNDFICFLNAFAAGCP